MMFLILSVVRQIQCLTLIPLSIFPVIIKKTLRGESCNQVAEITFEAHSFVSMAL